jgi:hypothetical protein
VDLDRVTLVIERLTGCATTPPMSGRCCATGSAGRCSVPSGAADRDEDASDQWVKTDWPQTKQTPDGAEPASIS